MFVDNTQMTFVRYTIHDTTISLLFTIVHNSLTNYIQLVKCTQLSKLGVLLE